MWGLCSSLRGVRMCVFLYMCVCVITHAVISGKPPLTLVEMKGFPLSQSSFFVSMVLWFCQNPRENRGMGWGGGREKSMSPITNSSCSLAGCRHASTLTITCIHRQQGEKRDRRNFDLNFDWFVFHWEGHNSIWVLLFNSVKSILKVLN